jgi:hypothetical protein
MVDLLVESSDRATRWRLPVAFALAAGCYLLLLLIGSRLLNDADTYWQIVLGDWIVAHHQVPHVDTFSATMAGTPWISSQWLAQVLFAQSYAVAGWAGVVILTAAAIALAQGFLTRYLLERLATTPALVLSVAGLVLASPHMLARAHALALPVMVAWIAGLIRALDERRAPPFLLLPLMTLWANLHGGFTFGIFFIAPVALEALLTAPRAERLRVTLQWAGFGLLAIAAACITPYGPESILVTGRILGLGQALALIREWQPQDFSILTGFELCLLLGIGYTLNRGLTMPPIRILMLIGLLHMALTHARNGELLGLLAPLVVAAPLAPQIGRREHKPAERHGSFWPASLALILVLGLASGAMAQFSNYRPSPLTTPSRAVAAVKASGKMHILNSYNFGGYLIASGLAPFIDGRTELYGERFFMRHERAVSLQDIDGFLRLLHDYNIDVTLLTPHAPANGLLDHLKGWTRVYADDIAVVHVRTGPPSKDLGTLQ